MDRQAWAARTSDAEAHRRAAGRRRYNAVRTLVADLRRGEIVRAMIEEHLDVFAWGAQSQLAEQFGVSRSTICRDLQGILPLAVPCPTCRATVGPDRAWWAHPLGRPGRRVAWWVRSGAGRLRPVAVPPELEHP